MYYEQVRLFGSQAKKDPWLLPVHNSWANEGCIRWSLVGAMVSIRVTWTYVRKGINLLLSATFSKNMWFMVWTALSGIGCPRAYFSGGNFKWKTPKNHPDKSMGTNSGLPVLNKVKVSTYQHILHSIRPTCMSAGHFHHTRWNNPSAFEHELWNPCETWEMS